MTFVLPPWFLEFSPKRHFPQFLRTPFSFDSYGHVQTYSLSSRRVFLPTLHVTLVRKLALRGLELNRARNSCAWLTNLMERGSSRASESMTKDKHFSGDLMQISPLSSCGQT